MCEMNWGFMFFVFLFLFAFIRWFVLMNLCNIYYFGCGGIVVFKEWIWLEIEDFVLGKVNNNI